MALFMRMHGEGEVPIFIVPGKPVCFAGQPELSFFFSEVCPEINQ